MPPFSFSWIWKTLWYFLNRKLKAMERVKNEMPELRSITDLTDIPMKLTSSGKRFPAERQIWPKCSFLGRSYQISVISDSMLEIWQFLTLWNASLVILHSWLLPSHKKKENSTTGNKQKPWSYDLYECSYEWFCNIPRTMIEQMNILMME